MPSELTRLNLGQKIRQLREQSGKGLDEISRAVGMTRSLLVQIEQNVITPPVATLLNLAKTLGVELGHFFETEKKALPFTIVRRGKAKKFNRVFPQGKNPLSYSYRLLAPDKPDKRMEPFLVEFSASKEKVPEVAHDGDEFFFVLSGRIEFHIGGKKGTLSAGDSLYFESRSPHAFRALGRTGAKAVVVLYPH